MKQRASDAGGRSEIELNVTFKLLLILKTFIMEILPNTIEVYSDKLLKVATSPIFSTIECKTRF